MASLRIVLFDIDGTLLELHPGVIEVFVAAFAEYGLGRVSTDLDAYRSGSDPALVREILRTECDRAGSEQQVARVLDAYLLRLAAGIRDGSLVFVPVAFPAL